jgi:transposase-like protein
MPQMCTVCRNPEKTAIDRALLRNVSLRKIAREHGTSAGALFRHKQHIASTLVKAERAREVAQASSLLDRVEGLIPELQSIAKNAKRAREWQAATGALRETRACLELLARLSGELRAAGDVHFHKHAHLHASATEPGVMTDTDLELSIARDVAEATRNFDAGEIERLKSLLASLPALPAPPNGNGVLIEA